MEFRFDVRPLFSQPIIRVTNHMLPQHFRGDRRMAANTSQQISEIVDTIGEHSAKAQGLSKAVTTANKLRQSEQKLYLLADVDDGKRGSVIGMLKVGKKALYVFDENGDTKKVDAPCILDFYIHESRQRAGLGKDLFTAMLKEENWQPKKLAIDRPSDKLLGFLRKHYSLDKTIPQMNNFVIYDGFFDGQQNNGVNDEFQKVHITSSPNTALFGPYRSTDDKIRKLRQEQQASYFSPVIHNAPIGRYAAAHPLGSMGENVIHQHGQNINIAPSAQKLTPEEQNLKYSQRRLVVEKRSGLQNINDKVENVPQYVMPSSTAEIRRAGLDSRRTYMYGQPNQIANRVIENQTRLIAQNQLSNENNANANAANLNPSEPIQSHQPLVPQNQCQHYNQNAAQQNIPQQYIHNQAIPNNQIPQQQYIQNPVGQQNQSIPNNQIPQQQYVQNPGVQAIPQQQYNQAVPIQNQQSQQPQQQQYIQNQGILENQKQQQQNSINAPRESQLQIQPNQCQPCNNYNQAAVNIINGPVRQRTGESNSHVNDDQQSANEEVETVRIIFENLNAEPEPENEPEEPEQQQIDLPDIVNDSTEIFASVDDVTPKSDDNINNRFHRHNKQHTGMKNLSTGVGAAVTPTNKMEFYQENPEDFGIVKINHPTKSTYSQSDNVSVVSVGSGDGYTRQGHYDLKFHHNTLW